MDGRVDSTRGSLVPSADEVPDDRHGQHGSGGDPPPLDGLFHHPRDRWPDAVDIDRLARYARAFIDIAGRLANAGA